MIKEEYFYRKFNSSKFIKTRAFDMTQEPALTGIMISADKKFVFCPLHNKTEEVKKLRNHHVITDCGHKITGLPVVTESDQEKFLNTISMLEGKAEVQWQHLKIRGKEYNSTPSSFNRFQTNKLKFIHSTKEKSSSKGRFYSSADDIFASRLRSDFTNFCLTLEIFSIDTESRKSINGISLRKKQEYSFSIKTGSTKNIYDCSVKLTPELFNLTKIRLQKIINAWAGFSVSTHMEKPTINELSHATVFPYDPGLNFICQNYLTLSLNVKPDSIYALRDNPDCYNKTCELLQIKSFRNLRKLFYKNPDVLIYCSILKNKYGFTDINLIYNLLENHTDKDYILSYSQVIFYINLIIREKSELVAAYRLKKLSDSWSYIAYDALNMFQEYYHHLDQAFIRDFLNEGPTEYNHDVLSGIVSKIEDACVTFEYSSEDKKLEDEIEDYVFKLPVDSDQLRNIGAEFHNCVASYKKKIINRDCRIVYAEKEGQLRICAEITGNTVNQQLTYHNAPLIDEDKRVMELYNEKHNLTHF